MGAAVGAVPLLLTALGTAAQVYNTNRTLSAQDNEAARGIRRQSDIQRRADARVNAEVDTLAQSSNADERAQRMQDYLKTLGTARQKTEAGLDNEALGSAFNEAGDKAKGELAAEGSTRANLMSGIDAPGLQRQGEAFGFGNLATDVGLIGRESAGQQFLTDLRMRSQRRNPWLDFGGSALQGLGQGMATRGTGGMSGAGGNITNDQWLAAMRQVGGG